MQLQRDFFFEKYRLCARFPFAILSGDTFFPSQPTFCYTRYGGKLLSKKMLYQLFIPEFTGGRNVAKHNISL